MELGFYVPFSLTACQMGLIYPIMFIYKVSFERPANKFERSINFSIRSRPFSLKKILLIVKDILYINVRKGTFKYFIVVIFKENHNSLNNRAREMFFFQYCSSWHDKNVERHTFGLKDLRVCRRCRPTTATLNCSLCLIPLTPGHIRGQARSICGNLMFNKRGNCEKGIVFIFYSQLLGQAV